MREKRKDGGGLSNLCSHVHQQGELQEFAITFFKEIKQASYQRENKRHTAMMHRRQASWKYLHAKAQHSRLETSTEYKIKHASIFAVN